MNKQKAIAKQRLRRQHHVRHKLEGTTERPRLAVFRSSKHIYAQLIDDVTGATLAAASSNHPELRTAVPYGGNVKAAQAVGQKLAEKAKEKGIDKAAFDRRHYRFHGRIKALADAANAAGLKCTEPKPGKKPKAAPEPAAAAKEKAPKEKGDKAPKEKKEKKEAKAKE